MIVHQVKQGTPEWLAIRAGKPTASKFDVLMTAKARKGELTVGSATYMRHLLAEWLLGQSLDDGARGGFPERGIQMEPQGRAWYSFTRDVEVAEVGFITNDAGTIGCSLDGIVSSDGTIENKCKSLENHIQALLESGAEHVPQIQGGLWIAERDWCDRIYYNPAVPPIVVRIMRDDDYIADLDAALRRFLEHVDAAKEKLLALGCKPADPANAKALKTEMDEQAADFDALVAEGLPSPSNATLLGELQKQREARSTPPPAGK